MPVPGGFEIPIHQEFPVLQPSAVGTVGMARPRRNPNIQHATSLTIPFEGILPKCAPSQKARLTRQCGRVHNIQHITNFNKHQNLHRKQQIVAVALFCTHPCTLTLIGWQSEMLWVEIWRCRKLKLIETFLPTVGATFGAQLVDLIALKSSARLHTHTVEK